MTTEEARLMENVRARARSLFADGYRARWQAEYRLEIRNGRGSTYQLDTKLGACTCPFFRAGHGRRPCKHTLGWKRLLARQRALRHLLTLLLLRVWRDLDDHANLDDNADATQADLNDAAENASACALPEAQDTRA